MNQDDCYQLGEVIKTHGLTGQVSINLDVDFPEEYKNLESVFLEQQGRLVPFFISTLQINGSRALVRFEDVDTIELASELVRQKLFLPLTSLPELPADGYYFHELVGCTVLQGKETIGVVKEVIDLSGNQLLSVTNAQQEHLIPLKDEFLKEVSIDNKRIIVELPDGLLEINS